MLSEIRTGPSVASDGTTQPARGGKTGEYVVGDAHARYFEGASRGLIFSAANQAAQAVSVALATAYTGLMLYNPVGSGVRLSPTKLKFALSAAPVAIAPIGLIVGWAAAGGVTAQTAKLVIQSNQIGNAAAGKGIVLSSATIVTPTWGFQLWDGFTAAALPSPQAVVDLEGMFDILPGGFLGIGALTAVTGLGAIAWEEVPIV